jgi:hypothetical protein
MCCASSKPLPQKTNLLEGGGCFRMYGRKGILQLYGTLFIEKGAMP